MRRRLTTCLSVAACVGVVGGTGASPASADRPGHLFGASSLAIAPDGAHVYAGQGLGSPYVALSRDASTSRLRYMAKPMFPGSATGATGEFRRTIAVSPDSKDVYDSENGANALRHMRADGDTVLFGGSYANYTGGIVGLNGPAQVAVSPDGQCVYVTATGGNPTSIVAFRRHAGGDLSFAAAYTSGPEEYMPWGEMAFSADGRRMYAVTGLGIGAFARDEATCAVTRTSFLGSPAMEQLTGIAIAPDGRTLYAVAPYVGRLLAFDVDPGTGTLEPLQTLAGGPGGAVAGLDGVNGAAVSPDGRHVYTSSGVENAVAAFTRSADGRLAPAGVWREGEHGIAGLAQATSLVASSDGRSVYVSSRGDGGGVVAFARDESTGGLAYAGTTTEADGPSSPPPPPGPGLGPGPGPSPLPGPAGGGHVGVSINGGARYTNDPQVRISVVWPAGASNLLISNDGGFGRSRTFRVGRTVSWRLDSSGPERLPKTIYARFDGSTQTFQDDIILDETAPRVVTATVAPQGGGTTRATSLGSGTKKSRNRAKTFRITVKAVDRTSGVSHLQVTASKRKPGRLLKHRSRLTVKVSGGQAPRYVRARDRAGNYGKWYRLKARKSVRK